MLSLLVSASVWVSWYHSLVSVSVRPTPWPCISPISHTSVLLVYCQPKPQISWYVGGISAIFPGHCCLCLARCVCKSPHREGDKHTLTVTHIYKPHHIAAHTLYGEEFTVTNSLSDSGSALSSRLCILQANTKLDFWPSSQELNHEYISDDKLMMDQVKQAFCSGKFL